jgi:hypothetical protein
VNRLMTCTGGADPPRPLHMRALSFYIVNRIAGTRVGGLFG